jgi:hypothetical protein
MKTTLLKISAFLLVFLFSGAGCEKEDTFEDIPLEYDKCPCASDLNYIKKITLENVLLFDATKTSFDKMQELTFDGERSFFVRYKPETGDVTFFSVYKTMVGACTFCNFPLSIKQWEINSNGVSIQFHADEYKLCEPKTDIVTYTYSNCILTTLKRKI